MKPAGRAPRFSNLEQVLAGKAPDRATLFEFFLNDTLYRELSAEIAGISAPPPPADAKKAGIWRTVKAFYAAGYDYATCRANDFGFFKQRDHKLATISQNEGSLVASRQEFTDYPWSDPDDYGTEYLDYAATVLEPGMKLIVYGPGGVLENVTDIVSYERLCFMLVEEPSLAADVFGAVGERLVRYYEKCADHSAVGAVISNDDWGFKTQTLISPAMMAEYVFPWHKRIVDVIHRAGRPAILHSCGNLFEVMDSVIDYIGYDAKHSFEDAIMPIEEVYELWGSRIAILGGIDMDFLCTAESAEITRRSRQMLELAADGGYALGSGNSIPEYVPTSAFAAMTAAAW